MSAPSADHELRRPGESDLVVGPIAYGCWRMADGDVAAARDKVLAAVECGWTLIDTADIYGWDGSWYSLYQAGTGERLP